MKANSDFVVLKNNPVKDKLKELIEEEDGHAPEGWWPDQKDRLVDNLFTYIESLGVNVKESVIARTRRECFLFVKEKLEARKNYARKEWENAYSEDYEKNKCKVLAMRHLENEMTSLLSELVLLEETENESKEKEEVKN